MRFSPLLAFAAALAAAPAFANPQAAAQAQPDPHEGHARPNYDIKEQAKDIAPGPGGTPAACDEKCEDSYKRYLAAYCGEGDAAACQQRYGEGMGAFIGRWEKLCADGREKTEFDEPCSLKISAKAAPQLFTKEGWAAAAQRGGSEALLLSQLKDLQAYQKGYESASLMFSTLESQTFTKDQFKDSLKRRTERLTPTFGTDQDPKFRAVNLIYLYLGDDAKAKLVGDGKPGKNGSNPEGGKLAFLERAEKVGVDNLSPEDRKKYLNQADEERLLKAASADKAVREQGEAAGKSAKSMMEALAKGRLGDPTGAGAPQSIADGPGKIWAGDRVTPEQIARQQQLVKAAQVPENFKKKAKEPPPANVDVDEIPDGCHSFLGWRCVARGAKKVGGAAVHGVEKGAGAVGHGVGKVIHGGGEGKDKAGDGLKKAGHEIKEAFMFGGPRREDVLKRRAAEQAKAQGGGDEKPLDEKAALAKAKGDAHAAASRAEAAARRAQAAAEKALKAAGADAEDAYAAKASQAAQEAAQAAKDATEAANKAGAATTAADAAAAAQLAIKAADAAGKQADEALKAQQLAETAVRDDGTEPEQANAPATKPKAGARRGGAPAASIESVKAGEEKRVTYGIAGYNVTERKDKSGRLLEIDTDKGGATTIQVVGAGEIKADASNYTIPKGTQIRYRTSSHGQYVVRSAASEDIVIPKASVGDYGANPNASGKTEPVAMGTSSKPIVVNYAWGKELKQGTSAAIREVDFANVQGGAFVKVLDKEHALKPNADSYTIPAGAKFQFGAGDGRQLCGVAKEDLKFPRDPKKIATTALGDVQECK